MAFLVRHVETHPRTGRLSYRRVYPAELRPFIPGNRRELKVSLGEKALTDGQALRIFNQASARYDAEVALARKVATQAFDPLDPSSVQYLANTYLARELMVDERGAWGEVPERGYPRRADLEGDYCECREMLKDRDREGLVAFWTDWAPEFAKSLGFLIDPRTKQFGELCIALGEAACNLWLSIDARHDDVKRLDGKSTDTPPEPLRPKSVLIEPDAPSITFETIAESILTNVREAVSATTQQGSRTALRLLREAVGPIKPKGLTRLVVTEWLDLMAQKPAKVPRAHQALSLPQLVALYADKPGVLRLSGKTIDTHLGAIAALWRKGRSAGLIDDHLPDPFSNRRATEGARRKMPKGFSLSELNAIFSLPIFTQGLRPVRGRGEASYWLPLMLLWTGARPEEIAQMVVADVIEGPNGGRWMMTITDEGLHPIKGQQSLKTTKKESGTRTFPVPQALIDLGFLDYVAWLVKSGEVALFPRLTTKNARKLLFPSFGEWWSLYLRDNDALAAGGGRQPSREFRHSFATAARASGIPRDAREYLMGHRAAGATANEGYGEQEALGLAIDQLRYAGLDLTSVLRWTAPKA
jgi:integrase